MAFQSLKSTYATCTKCPQLCTTRTQVVFGSGNQEAEILLIGEAPGANEDKNGIPFCGMSGKILDELLESANLNKKDVFITNTILCRPPKNRNPKKEELQNCKDRLDQLITIMKPKVIVTIGNFATKSIIGKTEIKKIRGKIFNYNNITVIPVIHPAGYIYSGRNKELFKLMKDDFKKISKLTK